MEEKCFSGGRPKRGDQQGELIRYAKAILVSVLIGEAVTMGMLFLFSLIICKIELPPAVTDVLVVLAAAVGAFASGYLCGKVAKEKGLLLGLVCGGVMLAILLLFSLGFHQPSTPVYSCVKAALVLSGAMLGGILGVNRRKKRIKY